MSLQEEIRLSYIDGNGLVSPNVCTKIGRASDNGVLFTSQYIMLQLLNSELTDTSIVSSLYSCVDSDGYLHRAPNDTTPDAPDDHYGYLALANYYKLEDIKLPLACFQPALIYLRGLARGNPLTRLFSPLIALIIAFSNVGSPKGDTSNRLLTWCLIQGSKSGILCRLAGRFWEYRQTKVYGVGGSREAARIYFQLGHPLVKYWRS